MYDDYPAVSNYGFLSDCHSAALVSKSGSIDWCCMPRIDSASCFGRILSWESGGYCQIAPKKKCRYSHRYIADTLVLQTIFRTSEGEARLLDCFTIRKGGEHHPHHQLLRSIEITAGQVEIGFAIEPVFDYGAVKAWIRPYKDNSYVAMGGSNSLLISGDVPLELKHRHSLETSTNMTKGERRRISICWHRPEDMEEELVEVPPVDEFDPRLEETIRWWKAWSAKSQISGPYAEHVKTSAIVLKGLSHAPTGAIAAAATTSLPESVGSSRNWDYRYSWIRDSSFSVRSLSEVGHFGEGQGFRRFIERSAAGSAEQLQVLFGVGGERRRPEVEIAEMKGYRGSKPVRVGNTAFSQFQLDAFGDIVDLAWMAFLRGESLEDHYWEFLAQIIAHVAETWQQPDNGIWEVRGRPRHFVHSKVMCWSSLDHGIEIAEGQGLAAPLTKWKKTREEIRAAVETRGYDSKKGVFIQAFDHPTMDSALLLIPRTGFIDYTDERFVNTTDAIRNELSRGGLLLRYLPGDDGLEGEEGCFLACSFWLAACLARQNRFDEAHEVFTRVLSTGNDLRLFAEEYDVKNSEMLGNFPQGLTHLSLIEAAVALQSGEFGKTAEPLNRRFEE